MADDGHTDNSTTSESWVLLPSKTTTLGLLALEDQKQCWLVAPRKGERRPIRPRSICPVVESREGPVCRRLLFRRADGC